MSSAKNKNRKLMDEVRDSMRFHHCRVHKERSYCDWIQRFIHLYNMKSRDELTEGRLKSSNF